MAQRPSVPGGASSPPLWRTQLVEENRYYRSSVPAAQPGDTEDAEHDPAHDHWFWTFLALDSSSFPSQRDFPFTLGAVGQGDALPPAAAFVTITLAALGGSHRVQASINGVRLGDLSWQGSALYEAVLTVPPGSLQAGENRLSLELVGIQTEAEAQAEGAAALPAVDAAVLGDPVSAPAALAPVLVDRFAVTWRPAHPLQLGDASDAAVVIVEPGSWQLQLADAGGGATLLDIGDPLHPVVAAPLCDQGPCGSTWGLASSAAGAYAVVSPAARLAVDVIEEDTPSQWRTPGNGADYILIAHRSLWAAAERLAAHRRGQGLRVALVDVQDIYDEFNGGQADAAAIRAFLAYAWSGWQPPAPTYVLLLGDGTFDPRGYCTPPGACPELATAANSTLIPPYLAAVDPWLGETAADNRFVALDPGSSLPWLAIGRLPANDPAEAQAMVDKILAYEASLPAQAGERAVAIALVSDNAYAAEGALDPAGNFWQASDAALAVLQQAAAANGVPLAAERFYLNICEPARFSHCLLPEPPYRPYGAAPDLVAAFAAWLAAPPLPGTAAPLVHYVGHGAITGWAGQPALLQTADVAALGVGPRLPLVLDITCYTGYFHFPGLASLAEAWLGAPQHGALAVIASSGLDLVAAHAAFDAALLAELGGQHATTIGQAFLGAKLAAAAGGLPQDVDTFHLFGDPAMPLWPAGSAPVGTPLPTAPAATATPPASGTPPGTPPLPSFTPPVTPGAPPTPPTVTPPTVTPAPDPLPDSAFRLYLSWLSTELGR